MSDETAVGFDFEPFAEPFPEMCGIDRIDIDNVKEWMLARDDWEAVHGKPRGRPSHDGWYAVGERTLRTAPRA